MDDAPLIVTCSLDARSFAVFDALRRAHFPPASNHLSAHLTLFHHLPREGEVDVKATLRAVTQREAPPLLAVTGLRKLGRGTAFAIDSPALCAVRRRVAEAFADVLTPQDRQGFRPHVTVQNKVEPACAVALHAQLTAGFEPWTATGLALALWNYRGGPWEPVETFVFCG